MYFKRLYELREDNDYTKKTIAEYLHMTREVYRRYYRAVTPLHKLLGAITRKEK